MKVRVKQALADLTDGRERFAGLEGEVRRPPAGRLDTTEGSPTFGQHFEHAYEVWFADGDHSVFLCHELEGDDLPEWRDFPAHAEQAAAEEGGQRTAGTIAESATVTEVPNGSPTTTGATG